MAEAPPIRTFLRRARALLTAPDEPKKGRVVHQIVLHQRESAHDGDGLLVVVLGAKRDGEASRGDNCMTIGLLWDPSASRATENGDGGTSAGASASHQRRGYWEAAVDGEALAQHRSDELGVEDVGEAAMEKFADVFVHALTAPGGVIILPSGGGGGDDGGDGGGTSGGAAGDGNIPTPPPPLAARFVYTESRHDGSPDISGDWELGWRGAVDACAFDGVVGLLRAYAPPKAAQVVGGAVDPHGRSPNRGGSAVAATRRGAGGSPPQRKKARVPKAAKRVKMGAQLGSVETASEDPGKL